MAETKAGNATAKEADTKKANLVYRWIGDYAQEFEGPNETTQFAAPGDYVEINDLGNMPLAQEFVDNGLLIEAPGYQPGPAMSDEAIAEAERQAAEEAAAATEEVK